MTKNELTSVLKLIKDCDDYLEGRVHSKWIDEIALSAAQRAVIERKENLYDRLRFAGLNLVDEEA